MANYGYIGKSDVEHAFCHNYIKKLDKLIERLKQMRSDFVNKKEPPKKKMGNKNGKKLYSKQWSKVVKKKIK